MAKLQKKQSLPVLSVAFSPTTHVDKLRALVDRIKKETAEALTDEALAEFVNAKLLEGKLIERAEDVKRDYEAKAGV